MQGGKAQAAAERGQGGELRRGRQIRYHHATTTAQDGGAGAVLGLQGGQLELLLGREAGREIQLRRLAVFQQRNAAQGRLMVVAEDLEDFLQLLRQRGQLQQAMIEALQDLQIGDLQLQLFLTQLQPPQVVVTLLFQQPAGVGGSQQGFADLADLQDVTVRQHGRLALAQGLGSLLQCLHRLADPPRQQQGHCPGERHRQHQATAIEGEGAIGGGGHLFGGDGRGHHPSRLGQAYEGSVDILAFTGPGETDAFVAGLRQQFGQTRRGALAEGFVMQAGPGDAQAPAIKHRADPVPGQATGHAGHTDALRSHHGGQYEVQLAVALHRHPYRKGELAGRTLAQLPNHRAALGDDLGEAFRLGQRPRRLPVLRRDAADHLAIRGGEQHCPPPRYQRQNPLDQGSEALQVGRRQQRRLGQGLKNGHRTAQFALDGGGGLAAGFQGPLFGFVLLVMDEQPQPQPGHQRQGHDPGEGNGQQAVAQGDQVRRAGLRRRHRNFDGGKGSF